MTYSNKPTRRPSPSATNPKQNPAQIHAAYIAAAAPMVVMVFSQMMLWLAASRPARGAGQVERALHAAKVTAAIASVATLMVCLSGSRPEKQALYDRIADTLAARFDRLRQSYIIWRQRKCWMWGGGFMRTVKVLTESGLIPALGLMSFDALIPN